ncbi:hypothetical protein [Tateyamaria pelophila]|uniref:hypothetical protein n=1 Tax=Tateyamaria pelophila TaxID=328415 RepID=UPI001CC0ABA4|nr:hypothetical protein [Tateyamaria pelophila]
MAAAGRFDRCGAGGVAVSSPARKCGGGVPPARLVAYRPGTPPRPIRWVLARDPEGKRDPQAFFSTDTTLDPADIIALFVRRWQVEVTFAETRAHLGVETQRQWSDEAIARTTPTLLALYSLISLWACDLLSSASTPYAAAWYRKTNLTFSDAIASVRRVLWVGDIFQHSP